MFTINNLHGTHELYPYCGPWGCWSQVFLRSNGVELDNIPYLGRFQQQYCWNQLSMADQYGEAGICGFAGSWDASLNYTNVPVMGVIQPNASYTCIHKLPLSLFNSGKLLPTRYAPLEIELSLNPVVTDWLNSNDGASSLIFSVSNVQVLYDAYIVDSAVADSFYKALLSNRVLSVPTLTVSQVVQSIPAGSTSFSFAAVRAFSRLSHVWLTFRGTGPRSSEFICPKTIGDNTGAQPNLVDDASPLSVRLSIGPHSWPDSQPNQSIPELFYQLQQALPNVPNMTRDIFQRQAFTIVFDLRKVPSDPTSSVSTRSGDLLRVDLQNLTANAATECWLTMFAFSVTAIRESGVTLLT
jgi:hypothetical protein